jgi:general secretion pathway protein E
MTGLRSLGEITDYLEVPRFQRVASHGDEPVIDLFSGRPNSLVVLEVRDRHFIALSTRAEYGSPAWFDAIEQGRRLGWKFEGAYTCSEDILSTLLGEHVHEKEGLKARKLAQQDRELFARIVTDSAPLEWLRQCVSRAVTMQASDMHLEVRDEAALLRVRRDGIMRKVAHFPARQVTQGLAAGFTLLAQEGSRSEVAFNGLVAQSALIPLELPQENLLLRYQSHPVAGGFDVVLRILHVDQRAQGRLPRLDGLGYTAWQQQTLLEASSSAWGGVFIAGITGSGKTTTLSSLMRELAQGQRRKIIAIEDPVEYNIPGVTHLSIQRSGQDQGHNPFEAAMLAFLRMDPDVGMFGEIRDHFSGTMAHTAIQTGHKLLTTVHATSALGIVARLSSEQIGLRREDVCSTDFLSLMTYQALVPINCPHCCVPAESTHPPEILRSYEKFFKLDTSRMRAASPHGCPQCQVEGLQGGEEGHSGVKGMTVAAEVVPVDPALLGLLRSGRDTEARAYWMGQRQAGFDEPDMRGKEAWGHALYEVARGRLDPFHFEHCFGLPSLLMRSRALE